MNNYNKLIIFISVLILGFGGAMLYLSWPLFTGKSITLATMPVDPFDVLRGQYIAIRYEISTISNQNINFTEADVGKNIYVILKKDINGISRLKEVSFEKPGSDLDFIKGSIKSVNGNSVNVEYSIEQFFFERDARVDARGMSVEVKVDSSGQARIYRLLKDGEPLNIQYKNRSLTD
jgi:uncharacterized membrane-anchored protein